MTMTDSPALAAIWTSRSRSFPVGMPETARRKSRPRRAAGGPAARPFASFGAGFGEVEVLDDDGAGAAGLRGGDQGADGGAQVPVAGGGRQPGQVQADGGRGAEDVAVRRDDGGGEVAVVDVDRHHRACPQLVQGRRGGRGGLPGRVEVPAAAGRVVADVVADRAAGRLGGDLIAAVGEPDRARQPVAAVRPVRQMGQRGGQLDLQPALIGVPADRLVPPAPCPPPRRRSGTAGPIPTAARHWSWVSPAAARLFRLRSSAFPPRTTDTVPASSCRSTRASRACQRPEPDRLGVPLGGGGVPARPAGLPARRDRQPGLDPADAGLQAGPPGAQVLPGQPDLVLAGAGDRPGPPGRRLRGQRPLPHRPGPRPAPRVQPPLSAPGGKVPPGQRPQVPAHRPQHGLVPRATGAAGPAPARLPAPPPRTARQPAAGNQSPARHPAPGAGCRSCRCSETSLIQSVRRRNRRCRCPAGRRSAPG